MKLTGAAILVSRGMTVLQAVPAAYPYRSAAWFLLLSEMRQVPTPPVPEVLVPFLKKKVPIIVDLDEHPAMKLIERWGPSLKKKVEDACFANYQDKIASIGMNPSLPRIRKPNEVWKYIEVESIRIDARIDDTVVIHLVPAWDIDLQMEICIKADRIVYAGQFLMYSVDGYDGQ